MATAWFEKTTGSEVHTSTEDETMLLLGDVVPDWVRLPAELGRAEARVLGAHAAPCPLCRANRPVRHLRIEAGLGVAECPQHGFVWYRKSV